MQQRLHLQLLKDELCTRAVRASRLEIKSILATVKGDIHDIGKNIVKVLA